MSTGRSTAAWTPCSARNIFPSAAGRSAENFAPAPATTSYVDLDYFGVIDRGIEISTVRATGPHQLLREGGQEVRLNAESNFYGFRAVSNIDYLSSFLFRLAFSEVFTQAVNSEVKSQAFLSKAVNGFSLGGMVERYQNFFPARPTMACSPIRPPSMTSASCTLPASTPPASTVPWRIRRSSGRSTRPSAASLAASPASAPAIFSAASISIRRSPCPCNSRDGPCARR